MRNICSIDTVKNDLGYLNESRVGNEISLVIRVSSIENPYLEITLTSGDIVNTSTLTIENGEINYTVPSSYYLTSGTLKLRVRGTDYNSDYITFNIPSILKDTDDIIVKIDSGNFVIKKISKSSTYSTKEQLTGDYWIDGKPIYRKVVQLTLDLSTTGEHYYDIGLPIVDYLVSIKYMVETSSKKFVFNNALSALGINNNNQLYLYTNVKWDDNMQWVFILEYTKTTD